MPCSITCVVNYQLSEYTACRGKLKYAAHFGPPHLHVLGGFEDQDITQ